MKIMMTGGGSGGHITPILAVAHELKQLQPEAKIIYVGQIGDSLADVPAADPNVDATYSIWAGKLRRYHDEGWRQLLNVRTQALNVRDMFRIARGLWQSYWLIRRLRPDIIFTRGGFVSVPVALAGKLHGVPYVTHDSDSVPSLANRLIARWAHTHAVALPAELYPYPASKTVVVGVPVSKNYVPVTRSVLQHYRKETKLEAFSKVIFITGGGNGARQLNEAVVNNSRYLLSQFTDLAIVHVTGKALEAETNAAYDALDLGTARQRVMVHGFLSDLYRYSGAADVIVARGGATNLAEFAIQAKACLIVPSKQLGWNVKNSAALVKRNAVMQLTEDQAEQPERLGRTLAALLEDNEARLSLAKNLMIFAHPHAAADLAELLLEITVGQDVPKD